MSRDVFISYSRHDRRRVEIIARALEDRGLTVWWDPEIKTGAGFRAEINEALDNASAVVVIWSEHSVGSRFVCDEADEGAVREILFPALIDSVAIPLGFRQIQTADLTKWNRKANHPALAEFIDSIANHAGISRRPRKAPQRPKPEREPDADVAPKPKPKPRPRKKSKSYTITGDAQRAGLLFRSVMLTVLAAAAFTGIAYTSDFIFPDYRYVFIGAIAVLAFISRYGTFQADRASGAASTHLFSRSYLGLMFFSLVMIAPAILEGRIYAAALEGVQVRGIEGADINGVTLDASGQRLLSSSDDKTVRLWDVETGVQRGEFRNHEHWVWNADFSPDASQAVSVSRDTTARVWNTGFVGETINFENHSRSVYDVAWHPDGEAIATASGDQTVLILDPETGDALRTLSGHGGSVTSVDFNPSGELLASSSEDGLVRLWNWRTGARIATLGAGSPASDVKFSHDGALLAAATESGRVRIWNAATMARVGDIQHGARAFSVSFVDKNRQLATSGVDSIIRIWNVSDQQMVRELTGHKDAIRSLDSTNDGATLVSGSRDNTARVWDVASGKQKQIMGHVEPAFRIPVALDAPPVLTASRAPVPTNFLSDMTVGPYLLVKGFVLAAGLAIAALLLKGLLWVVRLRGPARWTMTMVLFLASGYAGMMMLTALPVEAWLLWLTLGFAPAAILAVLRWGVNGTLLKRR